MVTSALVRLTTTPEQPPGHAAFAPLFVNRSSKELETSVQVSEAWVERIASVRVQAKIKINAAPQRRNIRDLERMRNCDGIGLVYPARSAIARVFEGQSAARNHGSKLLMETNKRKWKNGIEDEG